MFEKWQCYSWEGNCSMPDSNMVEACHRRHAEINLIRRLQLKGSC